MAVISKFGMMAPTNLLRGSQYQVPGTLQSMVEDKADYVSGAS
jgi:hypothetical protein